MSNVWIPRGHHPRYNLEVDHHPLPNFGPLDPRAGQKLLWHTAEGTDLSGVVRTLELNGDASHFAVDFRRRLVVQMVPLNMTAGALEHPPGTPETNQAGCIQVEIADRASRSADWTVGQYEVLADLVAMIHARVPIPTRTAAQCSFHHPRRIRPETFIQATGHAGHVHVPHNDHTDPGTGFRWPLLRREIRKRIEA